MGSGCGETKLAFCVYDKTMLSILSNGQYLLSLGENFFPFPMLNVTLSLYIVDLIN
jgi:hypothetical protein